MRVWQDLKKRTTAIKKRVRAEAAAEATQKKASADNIADKRKQNQEAAFESALSAATAEAGQFTGKPVTSQFYRGKTGGTGL
jgi:regulator of protease activity HflC (stomatin/prohibitin superfamily)